MSGRLRMGREARDDDEAGGDAAGQDRANDALCCCVRLFTAGWPKHIEDRC